MSSRNIEDLYPQFRPIINEFLLRADDILGDTQAFITDGFRSGEEQDKLYAQGRTTAGKIVTNAKAGQSAHNFGMAIDIAFRKDGTKGLSYDIALYKKLLPLAQELGLEWGGTWKSFPDNPHYQLPNWVELSKKENESMTETKQTDNKAAEQRDAHWNRIKTVVSSLGVKVDDMSDANVDDRVRLAVENAEFLNDKKTDYEESERIHTRRLESLAKNLFTVSDWDEIEVASAKFKKIEENNVELKGKLEDEQKARESDLKKHVEELGKYKKEISELREQLRIANETIAKRLDNAESKIDSTIEDANEAKEKIELPKYSSDKINNIVIILIKSITEAIYGKKTTKKQGKTKLSKRSADKK